METIYKLALPREVQSQILTYTSTTCADIVKDAFKKQSLEVKRKWYFTPSYPTDPSRRENDYFVNDFRPKMLGSISFPTRNRFYGDNDPTNRSGPISFVGHHYKDILHMKQLRMLQRQNNIKGGKSIKEVVRTLMKL